MFEVTSLCGQISLGKQGENLARKVYFDEPVKWAEIFGGGTCELLHQRNGDTAPYPVVLECEDDRVCWKITSVDTANEGEGKCELRYSVGGVVIKSKSWTTSVIPSLGGEVAEVPDPYKGWVDEVLGAAEKIETEMVDLVEEAKSIQEETKDVLDAEVQRQENEQNRVEAESNREETFKTVTGELETLKGELETLKAKTEDATNQVDGLLTWGSGAVNEFIENSSKALDEFDEKSQFALEDFQVHSGTLLGGFEDEKNREIADFRNESGQTLEDFATQSETELEKVQTATEKANNATDRANEAVDNIETELDKKADKVQSNNSFANALKGTASGEVVSITDVSPIEHNMAVKLSNKNLLDINNHPATTQVNKVVDGDSMTVTRNTTNLYTVSFNVSLEAGKTYTISCESVTEVADYWGWYVRYEDGTYSNNQTGNRSTVRTITLTKNADRVYFRFGYGELTQSTIVRPQVTESIEVLPYTPYIADLSGIRLTVEENGTTYKSNADGTVEGVKSIYPNTTLTTDTSGVLIECEYNKDTNKVIEELTNAIIALGGNV